MKAQHSNVSDPKTPRSRAGILLAVIYALGVLLSLFLFLQVKDEVFYSGDGGLKYLMVRQYARGDFSIYHQPPHPQWVKDIWESGQYPFAPPFTYDSPGGHMVVFPFLFQALSTPLFLLLGFRGLYVIPILALWLLWWRFVSAGRALGVGPGVLCLGLTALILASPLTLYGGMFWEFTLGALLVFFAVDFAVKSWNSEYPVRRAVLLGLLSGLSVWVRPEASLVLAPALLVLLIRYIFRRRPETLWFASACGLVAALFMLANQILYGHFLGSRGIQVAGGISATMGFATVRFIFLSLQANLLSRFPSMFFFLLALPLLFLSGKKALSLLLLATILVPCFAVPFLVPDWGGKQWGPRYLLVVIPLLVFACSYQLHTAMTHRRAPVRWVYGAVFLVTLALGVARNTYQGPLHLVRDYRERVRPALERLRRSDTGYIAVSNQWYALELTALCDERAFFWPRKPRDEMTLARRLRENGVTEFLYVTIPGHRDGEHRRFYRDEQRKVVPVYLKTLGVFGRYEIFEGRIGEPQDGHS